MAVVNLSRSFVYLANPHTASRGTVTALLNVPGSVEVAHHHANFRTVLEQCPEAVQCKTVFHIVRHPLDWLVSRFLNTGGQRGEFRNWLRLQKTPIFNRFPNTQFGKYETLVESLCRLTNYEVALEYEDEHKTPGKVDYTWYWEQNDIDWALKRFADDFEKYQYSTDIRALDMRDKADYR